MFLTWGKRAVIRVAGWLNDSGAAMGWYWGMCSCPDLFRDAIPRGHRRPPASAGPDARQGPPPLTGPVPGHPEQLTAAPLSELERSIMAQLDVRRERG